MNVAKLIKLAPTFLLVGFLGYSLFSMESGIPEAAEKEAQFAKGLEQMVEDVLAESTNTTTKIEGRLRDPFWLPVRAPAGQEAATKELSTAATDELAEVVKGMTLGATFLQGRDQLAVIDGRIYARGQRIAIPGKDSAPDRSMQVLAITRTGVLLKEGDRHYNLRYPEQVTRKEKDADSGLAKQQTMAEIDPAGQMEMFQRLLNSPLGAMGRGLIGDGAGRPAGAGKAARGTRAANSRPGGSGSGGP